MKDSLARLWVWLKERFSERSTKDAVFMVLTMLVALGLMSAGTVEAVKELIAAGQAGYVDISDLVAGVIQSGKGAWGIVLALADLVYGIFSATKADTLRGKTYGQIIAENGGEPEVYYMKSLGIKKAA